MVNVQNLIKNEQLILTNIFRITHKMNQNIYLKMERELSNFYKIDYILFINSNSVNNIYISNKF